MAPSDKKRRERELAKLQRKLAAEPAVLELPYDPMQLLIEGPIIFTDLGITGIHAETLRDAGLPVPPKIRCRFLLDTGADGCALSVGEKRPTDDVQPGWDVVAIRGSACGDPGSSQSTCRR
jgi:hypothetical protein